MSKHFSSRASCSRGIDREGNERDYWSFHSFNANTLIGQTVGRICNGFAAWRFHRRHPDLAPLVSPKALVDKSSS
ncbi:hypothetical protein M2397_005894 [Pseudomonas sp. BIGb0381]|uniref:hypothetical protein n=1 Tax=Pseudomonas sp. BIGb0381 TaxID=2940608 RepID=UPI00216AAC5E|nr:hypothetical protein [Pseudomonas sp. BIGb0381]MCS4315560.1 hypothetical protein [Pseudomonas sp. BIGb0381]